MRRVEGRAEGIRPVGGRRGRCPACVVKSTEGSQRGGPGSDLSSRDIGGF